MLAIGAAAGAASFTHVHDVAAANGQPGWLAWADAVVLELMSVASGLELRKRKRVHKPVGFPMAVLVVAVALSLSAQVVAAEPSVIGWIAAAIPALGFLVMVKMALAQAPAQLSSSVVVDSAWPADPSLDPAVRPASADSGQPSAEAVPDGAKHRVPVVPFGASAAANSLGEAPRPLADVLPTARAAADALAGQGRRVSRQALADALRADGQAVSNARASELLRVLKAEAAAAGIVDQQRRFQPVARAGKLPGRRGLAAVPPADDGQFNERGSA